MMESGASKEAIEDQNSDEGDSDATGTTAGHPWTVQEIQLCQMRGKDRDTGAYISVGSIELVD